MMKTNKRFGAFLLVIMMLVVAITGCAEVEKGETNWKPTGGDPNVESQPTAAPELILEYGAYANTQADATIANVLRNQVVMDAATGLWTEYENETTDTEGAVHVVSARYDLQTGYFIYQETVDGQLQVSKQFVLENGMYFSVDPISWIIVEELADSYVLISKDVLDAGYPFLDDYGVSTWADSSIRDWLNGTDNYAKGGTEYAGKWNFINRAFTNAELANIQTSTLMTSDNESYQTLGGGETTDLVYLLSSDEVAAYFSETLSAQSGATPYALHKGVSAEGNQAIWWLRSPGINTYFQGVDRNGDVSEGGYSSANTDVGIRPVIRVSKTAF